MGVTRDPLLTRLPSRLDSCQSSRRFFGFVKLRPVRVVPDVERRSAPCVMAALASVVHHRHALPVPRTTTARTINKGKFMAATADPRQPKSTRGPHERPLNAGHYQAANRANCAPAGLPGAFFEPKVIHRARKTPMRRASSRVRRNLRRPIEPPSVIRRALCSCRQRSLPRRCGLQPSHE